MNKSLFDFLKNYSFETNKVDRLLLSTFLSVNEIPVHNNTLLKSFQIVETDEDYNSLVDFKALVPEITFEQLIQLFEFVISPSDKIVNGAIYTPDYIRDYIVQNAIDKYEDEIANLKAVDLSCGCGGFLLTLTKFIKEITHKTFAEIFQQNIYGIDIAPYSVQRSRLLLSLYALANGEDVTDFNFNLFTDNSLTFDWRANRPDVQESDGFGIVVGNPPYVCSRNMDDETLKLMKNWEVASSGHPDLYIPFFQIGLEQLSPTGILGYITVNSFTKSINGRALRSYFQREDINITLINFGGEQVFRDRNTYTCICFLKKGDGAVNYIRTTSNMLSAINLDAIRRFEYNDLNHIDGWNLLNDQALVDFINLIENTGLPFKDLYDTKNGIATLKNDVYKFKPIRSDEDFHYLNDNGQLFPIEKAICKKIVNANKLKSTDDIDRIAEQIIFPYTEETKIISEAKMISDFPMTLAYLETKRLILAGRDKGTREYETWFAYGRRQSMDIKAFKLFFPHICERPIFVVSEERDLLFYNGIALVSNDIRELLIIKKVLESDLFFKYISNSTKDYASGYISMSRNYLKNFGVFQFTEEQKMRLLEGDDSEAFLEELYGVRN